MSTQFDIDIDFGDRDAVLKLIQHTPASMLRDSKPVKHNTGVYVNPIPTDPFTGLSSLDYETAEQLGYIKLDLLNVHVYNQIHDEAHLNELIRREPFWEMLGHREFVEQLIHLNNHFGIVQQHFPDTLDKLAMILAIIRPAKRHLIGKTWREISKSVWTRPDDDSYFFKRAHAYGYAQLVWVHMNLLTELTD
jgi:hypothetical protein